MALAIAKSTRSNAVSNVRVALRRLGLLDEEPEQLAAAWEALLAPYDSRSRAPFVAFAKFATLRKITPEMVTNDFVAEFADWIMTRALVARPRKVAATFRRSWNKAAGRRPGWPHAPLATPSSRRTEMLPLSAFPASFNADSDAFLERLATNDRQATFAGDTPPEPDEREVTRKRGARGRGRPNQPMRLSTIRTRRDHLRWAANAALADGTPISKLTSLRCLFTPETRAWAILKYFYRRAGDKPSTTGHHVGEVLAMIANIHLGLSDEFLAQLACWRKSVAVVYNGMTERNEKLIREVLEPKRYQDLLRLPFAAMEAAERRLDSEPRAAVSLALRALALQILLSLPALRLADLIGLDLAANLQRDDPTRGMVTRVWIPAESVKNRRLIAVPVGTTLAIMIEKWLTLFRPRIAAPGNKFLFPGNGAASITPQGMRDAVKGITKEAIGVAVSPHRFRHLNAITFL